MAFLIVNVMSSINIMELRRLVLIKKLFNKATTYLTEDTDLSRMLACHHLDMVIEYSLKLIASNIKPDFEVNPRSNPLFLQEKASSLSLRQLVHWVLTKPLGRIPQSR